MMRPATATLDYDFGLKREHVREDADKLTISGYASNWDLDRQGDYMSPRAFDEALVRFMSTNPILLHSHNYKEPMGRVTRAEVRPEGLYISAELPKPPAGTNASHIWNLVKHGILRAFSVGGRFTRQVINGVQTIVHADLTEISVASVGVNANTLFSVQAGKAFGDPDPIGHVRRDMALIRMQRTVDDMAWNAGLASFDASRAALRTL